MLLLRTGFCQSSEITIIPRILGGKNAQIAEFPWQLSLQEDGRHTCGASILTVNRALTAAHCYDNDIPVQNYTITAGSSRKHRTSKNHIRVKEFILHPHFNGDTNRADVAVLWLARDLIFNAQIQPIRLPKQNAAVVNGTKAYVAGWGRTCIAKKAKNSKHLKCVELEVFSSKECNIFFEGDVLVDQICAGWKHQERDSMRGDSGGALVSGNIQIGIVSWGRDCKRKYYPGVYTKVSYYTNWIKSISRNTY